MEPDKLRAHDSAYGTPAEVARELRCSPAKLCKDRREGRGPTFVRVGRKVLYLRTSVAAWVAANTTDPGRPLETKRAA